MQRLQRNTEWVPRFKWVDTLEEVADCINKPHIDDYPMRVPQTLEVLKSLGYSMKELAFPIAISGYRLHSIHAIIFAEANFAGRWRTVNVLVGNHRPPEWRWVPELMKDLISKSQYLTSIGDLYNWYHNFETIHPYQDGNGRVGGVIVAHISHLIDPKNGYLVPLQ